MHAIRTVVALALALCGTAAHPAAPAREVLPDGVVPQAYDLLISPDIEHLTFTGTVRIAIDVRRPTRTVTLNAVDLAFDEATVDHLAATPSFDAKLGQATLTLAAPLASGRHELAIRYHGAIGKTTLGLFAMDYDTAAGHRRTIATNLEPASARKVLPCWDQPDRKASFTISVDAPRNRMAVSNMPVAATGTAPSGLSRVRFAPSPKMSTYLLFLGIGDFERVHAAVDGVDVGVLVNRGETARATYALSEATRLLHFYNGYFGTPYPLPKLDLVVAPGEIEGGSMENWGAIFYSQHHLLFDPARSTERDRRTVFSVVAHEMAHQWFGDLVTMAWWDDLWLNEGFARWMQTCAADALHPEWQTGLAAADVTEQGKQADALPSTHPVLQPVATVDQALQAFDDITYAKGAAIVTMISAAIGPDAFREGLRRYMRAHAYGNTVDTDLWSIMQQVAGKPILKIEHDFTRREGLPLVRVAAMPQGLVLSENRFVAEQPAPEGQRWAIPLAVGAPGTTPADVLLEDRLAVAGAGPRVVNLGQSAFVRVLYPDPVFAGLLPRLPALAPADQLGLLNDGSALGFAGYAPESRALAVIARLPASANLVVWRRAIALLAQLDGRYGDTPARTAYRRAARALLAPLAARLGPLAVPGEDPGTPLARDLLGPALGLLGDESVIAAARATALADSGTPEQRRTALTIAAASADAPTFDALLARARATKDPLFRQQIYQALAGVGDETLARRLIAIALTDEVPAGGNVSVLAIAATRHPDLAWALAVPHLADPALGMDKVTRWLVAQTIASQSARPERIAEARAYAEAQVPAEARKPFEGAYASIRSNGRIAQSVLPEVDRWVAANAAVPGLQESTIGQP